MTRLQRVSVEGFKAIESLEFEPGAINVVTGRNNTGKTSLLEAIDLTLQPSYIGRYGQHLDTLITHSHDESRITANSGEKTTELKLSYPCHKVASDWIIESTHSVLHENWELLATDDMDRFEAEGTIKDKLPGLFDEYIEDEKLDGAVKKSVNLNIDGADYPYIYFGGSMEEIILEMLDKMKDELSQESNENRGKIWKLTKNYRRATNSRFVYQTPPHFGKARFINFVQLSKPLDLDSNEEDPVKIDDISDFLREKEIVDNLKTFDLDYLIFEEEGEKYPVPFEHMGEGFKTIVGVLWHLLDVDESADIVLLEEPDTHMHPGYVRQLVYFLVDLAREEDIQLFVTTHNNDFLNDFFTENIQARDGGFLKEEFRLVQMQDEAADVMTYEEAEKHLKDLHLDLRGI